MKLREKTERVVFHHALADNSPAWLVDQWHRAKGWSGIGYHYVIRKSGDLEAGRDVCAIGAHARGRNRSSVGVLLEGDFRHYEPSVEQLRSAGELFHKLCTRFDKSLRIEFHRSRLLWNACPGRMLDRDDFLEIVSRFDPFLGSWSGSRNFAKQQQ